MSKDKYKNEKGVYIEVHTDKRGKDHISFYDKNPREKDHGSIHINWDSETGKGKIVDTTDDDSCDSEEQDEKETETETTDIGCFLTTACMKYYNEKFCDNCYELTILRWFRDNFVTKEDIEFYYNIAPKIVESIANDYNQKIIYEYIYENIINKCIELIENGEYAKAYLLYKNNILSLKEFYLDKNHQLKLAH